MPATALFFSISGKEASIIWCLQVLGLSKLRKRYKQYDDKKQLCAAYDVFLADDAVPPNLFFRLDITTTSDCFGTGRPNVTASHRQGFLCEQAVASFTPCSCVCAQCQCRMPIPIDMRTKTKLLTAITKARNSTPFYAGAGACRYTSSHRCDTEYSSTLLWQCCQGRLYGI